MLNLTLRQLRTLIAISRHRKISHAASALGLTSPAVTLQLQQIESELRAQLFIREKTGVITTEMGKIVLEHARIILSNLEALQQAVDAFHGLNAGTIRLGVVSTGKYFAPRAIAAFAKKYPEIEIKLFAGNRTEIIRRLREHEIDIALMGRSPRDFAVKSTIVGDHPHVFIANPGHPLANELDIDPQELAKHRFITREQGSGTRSMFELFMAEVSGGLQHAPVEMDSNETIKQAVAADLGIAFLSGHTIEQELESQKLIILDVKGTPIRRHWFVVHAANRAATPAMDAFEMFMFENGKRLLPLIGKPESANAIHQVGSPDHD